MANQEKRSTQIIFSQRQLKNFQKQYNQKKFAGLILGITGNSPWSAESLRQLAESEGGIIGDENIWQFEQIMVVGSDEFDMQYLNLSIQIGIRKGFQCAYLSQEAFLDLILKDEYPAYYKGDPRIENHRGLSYLASLGFEWPSTDSAPGEGGVLDSTGWQEFHPLRGVYGYNVQRETSREVRLSALKRAVRPDGLGLKEVAYHIAFLIKNAKKRHDDLFTDAIRNWKSDLDWLHKTYYENSVHSFVWPD